MGFLSGLLKYGVPIATGLATGGIGGAAMAGLGALAKGKGSPPATATTGAGPKAGSLFDQLLADSFARSQAKEAERKGLPPSHLKPLESQLLLRQGQQ